MQFGLSIDRIKAIVRLKALEKNLAASGTELQMQFLNGMEQALGVSTGVNLTIKEPLDVAQETGQQYGVAKTTRYIMLDEENLEDVELVERELQARERRNSKAAASVQEGEDAGSAEGQQVYRSRPYTLPANDGSKSLKRSQTVNLEFRNVPGKLTTKPEPAPATVE